jgi:hypothetical protein
LVTFSAEYVDHAPDVGTQIARVTTVTIAERIKAFLVLIPSLLYFGGLA